MASMNFFIITAAGLILVVLIVKLIKNSSPGTDPWENKISRDEVDKLKREICLKCGTEVKIGQYYCSKCNHATGKYAPYLPFVNIRFNYSMHQTLWRNLKSKKHGFIYKTTAILFIALTAPIMILVYCPIALLKGIKVLWRQTKKL